MVASVLSGSRLPARIVVLKGALRDVVDERVDRWKGEAENDLFSEWCPTGAPAVFDSPDTVSCTPSAAIVVAELAAARMPSCIGEAASCGAELVGTPGSEEAARTRRRMMSDYGGSRQFEEGKTYDEWVDGSCARQNGRKTNRFGDGCYIQTKRGWWSAADRRRPPLHMHGP